MIGSTHGSSRPGGLVFPVVAAAAVAALAWPRLAGAQGTGDPLAEAEAAYGAVDFDGALLNAQEALEAGGLTPPQLVRVYELIGISATALEQPDRAREAYVRMLALDPEARLDRTLSPSLRGPFMEARVTADLARQRGALRIDLADPLEMGRTLVVRARVEGAEDFAESRVAAAETTYVEVAGSAETPRVEFSILVLDEHGNRIINLGNDDVPEVAGRPVGPAGGGLGEGGTVTPGRPLAQRAWFWVVIGLVAAAAVGGGVAAGIVLYDQSQTVTVATDVSTVF
jgi:hypothetical protein